MKNSVVKIFSVSALILTFNASAFAGGGDGTSDIIKTFREDYVRPQHELLQGNKYGKTDGRYDIRAATTHHSDGSSDIIENIQESNAMMENGTLVKAVNDGLSSINSSGHGVQTAYYRDSDSKR